MARKGNGGEEKEEVLKVEKGGKDISFPTPACHLNKGGGREIERGTAGKRSGVLVSRRMRCIFWARGKLIRTAVYVHVEKSSHMVQ